MAKTIEVTYAPLVGRNKTREVRVETVNYHIAVTSAELALDFGISTYDAPPAGKTNHSEIVNRLYTERGEVMRLSGTDKFGEADYWASDGKVYAVTDRTLFYVVLNYARAEQLYREAEWLKQAASQLEAKLLSIIETYAGE